MPDIDLNQVRAALRLLDSFEQLGKLSLAQSEMVTERLELARVPSPRSTDRGKHLRTILLEAVDEVFPTDDSPQTRPRREVSEQGKIVRMLYVEGVQEKEAKQNLGLEIGMSGSTFDRRLRDALEKMCETLHLRNVDASRRRKRNNRIEEMLNPIRIDFQKEHYQPVITAVRAISPIIYNMGFWDDYREISKMAVTAAEKIGDEALAAEFRVGNLARVYYELEELNEAEGVARVALAFAESKGLHEIRGEAYRILAIVKRDLGDWIGSINDFETSRDAFRKSGSERRYFDVSGSLTKTYRSCHQWDKAESLLGELLEHYLNLQDPREKELGESMTRHRFASLYHERAILQFKNDHAKFEEYIGKAREQLGIALAIDQKHRLQRSIAHDSRKFCLIEMSAGNYDAAMKWLGGAKAFFDIQGYPKERAEIQNIGEELENLRAGKTS